MAIDIKATKLSYLNKSLNIIWTEKYLKIDFSTEAFSGACRATMEETGGKKGNQRLRRQQWGNGVMFWIGIGDSKIIGFFKVEEFKINVKNYSKFFDKMFIEW